MPDSPGEGSCFFCGVAMCSPENYTNGSTYRFMTYLVRSMLIAYLSFCWKI